MYLVDSKGEQKEVGREEKEHTLMLKKTSHPSCHWLTDYAVVSRNIQQKNVRKFPPGWKVVKNDIRKIDLSCFSDLRKQRFKEVVTNVLVVITQCQREKKLDCIVFHLSQIKT